MNESFNVGNISTIAAWLSILIMPIIIKYGIDIDQETLTTSIYALIMIGIALWSSYNPNTFAFLKNNKECECKVEDETDLINEEYENDGC